MISQSTQTGTCPHGIVLATQWQDAKLHLYVVLHDADLDAVADILPAEVFEADGDVHVCGLDEPETAQERLSEVLENMNDGDTAIVFCPDEATRHAALYTLRLPGVTLPPHLN